MGNANSVIKDAATTVGTGITDTANQAATGIKDTADKTGVTNIANQVADGAINTTDTVQQAVAPGTQNITGTSNDSGGSAYSGTNILNLKNNKGNTLNANDKIVENEYLMSNNGLYCFHMNVDGIARLFTRLSQNNTSISTHWTLGKSIMDSKQKYFVAQSDNNLVVYCGDVKTVLGHTGDVGKFTLYKLVLEDTRELVAYTSDGIRKKSWGTASPPSHSVVNLSVNKGNTLIFTGTPIIMSKNQYMMSSNGLYCFHVHTDGFIRLFTKTTMNQIGPIHFQIGTVSTSTVSDNQSFKLNMNSIQMITTTTGNDIITEIKFNNTSNNIRLVLEDTRELIIYDNNNNNILWRSNTGILSNIVKEGTPVKCDSTSPTVYRWSYGKLLAYPSQDIASSWDPQSNSFGIYDCGSYTMSGNMTQKPKNGDVIKCNNSLDKYNLYDSSSNKLTYYPIITDNILRQYGNYTNSNIWNNSIFQTQDCIQYDPSMINLNFNTDSQSLPLPSQVTDNSLFKNGSNVRCNKQSSSNIYRYVKENDALIHYSTPELSNTWDNNWENYFLYDCSRNWSHNSGVNYNIMSSKPSDGSLIKCSDDNNYYRYTNSNNNILLYKTPAIAKQYSDSQLLQGDELTISEYKQNFKVFPSYNIDDTPNYTFYFECCIENINDITRNILHNATDKVWPIDSNNRKPCVDITGLDNPPENRIQITHSTEDNGNSNIISNFVATPGKWFACCFIVNKRTMFTYFGNKNDNEDGILYKDNTITGKSNFTWGSKIKNGWLWNATNLNNGFIKVRNVRFWPFVMALDWPETFNPIEMVDEINPYTNKPTGNKIATTAFPSSINCKAFVKSNVNFLPTQTIVKDINIKDGDTIVCGNNSQKYRYKSDLDKLYKYPSDSIAKSWDPNYTNYKGYDCGTRTDVAGTLEQKPENNNVIKCSDDNKSYRYINDTNSLEWYMNDTIIEQYNKGWTVIDRKPYQDCNQFKTNRTTFVPNQQLNSEITSSLHDGASLKCNNTEPIYRYNKRFNILMKYPSNDIAISWDPRSVDNFYSYTCDSSYTLNAGLMSERPTNNTVIKCNDRPDDPFYYIYNSTDFSVMPKPTIEEVQNKVPNWNTNNILTSDCRQYYLREPRFYDDANGKGNMTSVKSVPIEKYNDCNPLPYVPTDVQNRSMIRDGANILIYTDPNCNNIYTNIDKENGKDMPVNIGYSSTNAYGDILKESNPSHYKIVDDATYNTLYNTG